MAKYYGCAAINNIADLMFRDSFHILEDDNEHSWISGFLLGANLGSGRNGD